MSTMSTSRPLVLDYALNFYKRFSKIVIALLLVLVLNIVGEIVVDNFFSLPQVLLTIRLSSFIALLGLCQMLVMIVGGSGLDLSVGYTATLTAVLTASIMDGQNANLLPAILVALLVGIIVGSLNGIFTAYVKLPPLVVTMAMANIVQGYINVYTAGANITGRPSPVLQTLAAKYTGYFPNILFVLFIVLVLVMIMQSKTKIGSILLGTGSNEKTAYLSGINVKRVRFSVFLASGIIASLVGLLLLGNMGIAFKDMGSNYVMPSIAAAVVGGVALSGGKGSYVGVMVGALFLQTLTNLLVALGWGDAGKWTGFGVVLFVLLILYVGNRRKR
ncbi:MAG: ABC transporter permease [Spirochaetota bacterium]